MRFKSPLSDLCDVLIQMQESANQYKTTLTKNEAATRAVLVDPVLHALGWNTANTNMVEVEKTINQVRADYALYDSNSIPQIIVEAKSLGTNLNQKNLVMSLVNYAFNFGLNDVFLTDGLIWQHFDNFQPGQLSPTNVLDIVNDDPVECAAYLVQQLDAAKFWPVEQTIDVLSQRIEELENTVSTLQKNITTIIANQAATTSRSKSVSNTTASPEKTATGQNLQFIKLDDLENITGRKPSHLQLPDGTVLTIKTWKDVIRETCKFVLAHNSTIPIPFPDRSGKKVSLFNTAKPPKGISYITEEYNSQTVYIYVNYDANNCIANAIYILKQFPQSNGNVPAAVVLQQKE